jgi:RNA polymerase sigma factor (sigma-70 family)
MRTVLNVARRTLRRRRSEPAAPPASDPGADPADLVDLRIAIRALPPRRQEAVLLHYVADLSVADVAKAMGCEEGTVKAHLAQARETLRDRLGVEVRDA